jgi:hypothetical protein
MRLEEALAQLEPLRHRDRVARCVQWGRQAARGDEEVRALLEALWTSPGVYARSLALWAWFGSRDVLTLLGALQDDSCTLRRRAAGLVHHLDDEGALRALPLVAHARTLRTVLVRLARQRRQGVIDAFVRALSPQDPRSAELVPFASQGVAAAWPGPLDTPAVLRRLASRHPALALQRLGEPHTLPTLAQVGPTLARALPDGTLALLGELLRARVDLSGLGQTFVPLLHLRREPTLQRLAEASAAGLWRPGHPALDRAVAEALPGLPPSWSAWAVRSAPLGLVVKVHSARWRRSMGEARLETVRQAAADLPPPVFRPPFALLHLFSADDPRREAIFQRWLGEPPWLPHELGTAPSDLRAQAARARWPRQRHEQHAAAQHLPPEEVLERLASALRHRDTWERGAAASYVVSALPAWPDRVAVVAEFARGAMSTDPVRLSILQALRALPLPMLTPEAVQAFEPVLHSTIDDPGEYEQVRTEARSLILRWMGVHPVWATRWYLTLRSDRSGTVPPAPRAVDPRALPAVDAELAPVILELCRNARWSSLLQLARELSPLLGGLPSVQEGLREQLRRDNSEYSLSEAVACLRSADPRGTPALLDELLDADPTLGRVQGFAEHVSWARQDLLAVALSQDDSDREEGRFLWACAEFPPVARGYGTWTDTQQAQLGEQLTRLGGASYGRAADRATILRMTRLGWRPEVLVAQLAHPDEAQREMAVRMIGRLDSRRASLEALEQTLGDERARWAIYAMNRVMAELAGPEVVETLRRVPLAKVTVAKEVVRLAGDRGGEAGFELLLEMLERDLHRDVRIAAQRGLWSHLHREEAWAPFEEAAAHEDPRVVGSLVRLVVPPAALPRLASLLARALSHPDRRLQHDLLERLAAEPALDTPALRDALLAGAARWHEELVGRAMRLWAVRQGQDTQEACRALLALEGPALARALDALIAQAMAPGPLSCAVGEALQARADPHSTRTALRALSAGGAHERIVVFLQERAQAGTLHAALLEDADLALSAGPQRALEELLSGSAHAELRWLAAGCLLRQRPRGKAQQAAWERRRVALSRDESALVRRRAAYI